MPHPLSNTQGFLIDLDGTLYQDDAPIPGAVLAVETLRERGYPVRFVTNTTSRCRASLSSRLGRLGIEARPGEILSPPYAAARYLTDRAVTRAYLLIPEDARREFEGIAHTHRNVEAVVVGDLGDAWSFGKINRAFRLVLTGAELIALGRSRYWRAPDGLRLDAGPFVAALEFATGRQARVLGKPAPAFFQIALDDLGLPAERVAMVGDDVETDVAAAQQASLTGVLVQTGKFQPEDLERDAQPDLVIPSIAHLARQLGDPSP